MLCHFAWETNGFDVDAWTSDTLIARHNFDLLEIVSGYSLGEWYSNNLQTSRYLTECAKGKKFAVVGVFDAPKATGAITVGAAVYWDATNSKVTTTATDNPYLGKAILAADSADESVRFLLNAPYRISRVRFSTGRRRWSTR